MDILQDNATRLRPFSKKSSFDNPVLSMLKSLRGTGGLVSKRKDHDVIFMWLQSQTNGIIKESITDHYYQNCNKKVTESINCGTRCEKREMNEIENE